MKKLEEFNTNQKIYYRGVVLADDFEEKLMNFLNNGYPSDYLLISLKNTIFIEIGVLMNLIAFIRNTKMYRENLNIYIQYPKDKELRDFLQVWRFPEDPVCADQRSGFPFGPNSRSYPHGSRIESGLQPY